MLRKILGNFEFRVFGVVVVMRNWTDLRSTTTVLSLLARFAILSCATYPEAAKFEDLAVSGCDTGAN